MSKYNRKELVLNNSELQRPSEYIKRMVKYSKGWLEFSNEEALEMILTEKFFKDVTEWVKLYSNANVLDNEDENLEDKGIIFVDDKITFTGKLIYSRFFKILTDEAEGMNDPNQWLFSDKNITALDKLNFSHKESPIFSSKLVLLKFYVLRKIDEVAFVTSRFVYCPRCNTSYVVPSVKIDFQKNYSCENKLEDGKTCKTALKKFQARKMIPTYIYEVNIEVEGKNGSEFKEFFLESFIELNCGFYNGMCFGRTENKSNAFYFTCLTAKSETNRIPFTMEYSKDNDHGFFNLLDSVLNHIRKVGIIIDKYKARVPMMIELMKKLVLTFNKECNYDHSLYFGAPGIGKTYALTLLHYMFYPNAGFISGPRFSLAGLTGGQKEILYQDTSKKKNVPGLFSNQAFIFDEINNSQFIGDDKAINLFKSAALSSSGTSSTVGGKEFSRVAVIAGTANYDADYLKFYENKVKKAFNKEREGKNTQAMEPQEAFLDKTKDPIYEVPMGFDYYAPLKEYDYGVPRDLKVAILKVRDEAKNYLTSFPKPLMERFYWTVLVHPKYDKTFNKSSKIEVLEILKSRKSLYSQRELFAQLYISNFEEIVKLVADEAMEKFNSSDIEANWSIEVQSYLRLMTKKYPEFFSMFSRIDKMHVFILYSLSLINNEYNLSFATRRVYERLVALLHTPITLNEFHNPDFKNFKYVGETRGELLSIIRENQNADIREFVDFDNRESVKKVINELIVDKKIIEIEEGKYIINSSLNFEEVEDENRKD